MNVSVIVTVKNEGATIGGLLDALCRQSRAPDEVIICDGGSTDDTVTNIESYQPELPLKLISFPGSNISQGRNRAIEEAGGPIIASTDAGVTLADDWLQDLARPIEEHGVSVVSGWFEPDPRSEFEVVMGATVLPDLSDIDPEKFLPSSRSVAFLKSAWERVGGYPEWLDFSEDIVFDLALRDIYGPFPFAPTAVAYFRPRGDLASYSRQYYRYARGDGKASLWAGRHAIRFVTYLLVLPTIFWLIGRGRVVGWALLLTGAAVYCRRPAQRLLASTTSWRLVTRLLAFVLIPLIRLVGDIAKMAGYPAGLYWRWRNR